MDNLVNLIPRLDGLVISLFKTLFKLYFKTLFLTSFTFTKIVLQSNSFILFSISSLIIIYLSFIISGIQYSALTLYMYKTLNELLNSPSRFTRYYYSLFTRCYYLLFTRFTWALALLKHHLYLVTRFTWAALLRHHLYLVTRFTWAALLRHHLYLVTRFTLTFSVFLDF